MVFYPKMFLSNCQSRLSEWEHLVDLIQIDARVGGVG